MSGKYNKEMAKKVIENEDELFIEFGNTLISVMQELWGPKDDTKTKHNQDDTDSCQIGENL